MATKEDILEQIVEEYLVLRARCATLHKICAAQGSFRIHHKPGLQSQ
jgi:hypothetical protein